VELFGPEAVGPTGPEQRVTPLVGKIQGVDVNGRFPKDRPFMCADGAVT